MKKMLLFATVLSSVLLLNAAETHRSAYSAGQKLVKEKKFAEGAEKFAEAGKLAEKQNDKFWSAFYETAAYLDGKMYDKAIEAAEKELKIALSTGKQVSDQQSRAYWQLGLIHSYKYDSAKAAEYYKKSAELAPKKSWLLQNSGTSGASHFIVQKKYDEAQTLYQLLIDSKEADPNTRACGLYNLCMMNTAKKNAAENLKKLENAETRFGKLNNKSLASIWDARGRNYYSLNQYDGVSKAYNEMLKYTDNESSEQAQAYSNLMALHLYKNDQATAAKYAQKALDCKKATWGRDVKRCKQVIADYQKSLKK